MKIAQPASLLAKIFIFTGKSGTNTFLQKSIWQFFLLVSKFLLTRPQQAGADQLFKFVIKDENTLWPPVPSMDPSPS